MTPRRRWSRRLPHRLEVPPPVLEEGEEGEAEEEDYSSPLMPPAEEEEEEQAPSPPEAEDMVSSAGRNACRPARTASTTRSANTSRGGSRGGRGGRGGRGRENAPPTPACLRWPSRADASAERREPPMRRLRRRATTPRPAVWPPRVVRRLLQRSLREAAPMRGAAGTDFQLPEDLTARPRRSYRLYSVSSPGSPCRPSPSCPSRESGRSLRTRQRRAWRAHRWCVMCLEEPDDGMTPSCLAATAAFAAPRGAPPSKAEAMRQAMRCPICSGPALRGS